MLNKDKLEYCNVLAWHQAGYTGHGVKVAHLEGSFNTKLPFFDGMIRDPFNRHQEKVQNLHQVTTADILHQVAPGAEIYALPSSYPAKPGLIESMEFCIAEGIPLATMSLGGSIIPNKTAKEIAAYEAGTLLCKSAGNAGEKGFNPATKQDHWWSVGACSLNTKGQVVRASYSSVGEELDVMSFGNVYVHDARDPNRAIYQTGTSFACPFFVGLLALYYQWHVETYGRYPTILEAKAFVLSNCVDLEQPGHDPNTGYGLFVLPDPAAMLVSNPEPREEEKPMPTVCLDPGHGGSDPGAIGQGGLQEKNVNLAVAKQVAGHLSRHGVDVCLTRDTDRQLSDNDRCKISNDFKADVFVSVHCNSAENRTAKGVETWYYSVGGQRLANAIQGELIKSTGLEDRKIKQKGFNVLVGTRAVAALTELAFISNIEEERLLVSADFQAKAALAMAKGILTHFGVAWQDPPTPPAPPAPTKVVLKLTVGGRQITRSDGKVFPLDVPARVENGRTLVPLRAIAEALGCTVHYDSKTGEITIAM